jgi:WD40 repeat protein
VETSYDLAYKDSKWLVVTKQDTKSANGAGEVYRLRDGSALAPYIQLPEMAHARNAVVYNDRWLVLGAWRDSFSRRSEEFNKVTIFNLEGDPAISAQKTFAFKGGTVSSITLGSHYLIVGMDSGGVGIVDLASGTLIAEAPGHNAAVTAIAFSDSQNLMVTGDAIGELRLWDLRTKTLPVVMATLSPFAGGEPLNVFAGRQVACRFGPIGSPTRIQP